MDPVFTLKNLHSADSAPIVACSLCVWSLQTPPTVGFNGVWTHRPCRWGSDPDAAVRSLSAEMCSGSTVVFLLSSALSNCWTPSAQVTSEAAAGGFLIHQWESGGSSVMTQSQLLPFTSRFLTVALTWKLSVVTQETCSKTFNLLN